MFVFKVNGTALGRGPPRDTWAYKMSRRFRAAFVSQAPGAALRRRGAVLNMLVRHPSSHRRLLSVGDGEGWRPQLPALTRLMARGLWHDRVRSCGTAMCVLRFKARPWDAAQPKTPGLTAIAASVASCPCAKAPGSALRRGLPPDTWANGRSSQRRVVPAYVQARPSGHMGLHVEQPVT